jgi:DNA-binding MarR family transcriptional regulator
MGDAAASMEKDTPKAAPSLDLGPLVTLIGFFLRRAQRAVYEDFLRDPPLPLTPGQTGTLVIIQHNPTMTQQDLCGALGVDKSTLALALDALASRGLLRRVRSKEDRRKSLVRLTAKGAAALEVMLEHAARHERRIFAGLSAPERKELVTLLRKIVSPGAGGSGI